MTNYNEKILQFPGAFDGRLVLPRHNKTKVWKTRDPAKIQGVVFHQSLEETGLAEPNARYHVGPNHISADGLPGLSYTLFAERTGRLVLANDIESITWSQGDAAKPGDENAMYLSLCFGGNFSGQGYKGTQAATVEQRKIATDFWQFAKDLWGWNNNQLFGHYDFGKPACPGAELTAMIEVVRGKKDWSTPKFNLVGSLGRQEAMRELGYYKGPTDGIWGPQSKLALVDFQRDTGLATDGVWGQNVTLAVLTALDGK